MNIFLGITGASGAPYAARLISSLAAEGCELGICISASGYKVLGTELYNDPDLPREQIEARLLDRTRFLPPARDDRRPGRLRRRQVSRPARRRARARRSVGTRVSVQTGRLAPDAVRDMFDRIAPVYDFMNRAMSLGLDVRWRRLTAEAVVRRGDRVLDACCGTGDLALAAEEAGGRVTGVDFSERMLARARRKSDTVDWITGDVMALPFAAGDFDVVTVGFGIRNLPDLEGGLRELARVLRPGGRLGCLEITQPRGVLRPFFRLWFDALVPLAGKALPGGSAYTYLPASVRRFPGPEHLAAAIERAGFGDVRWQLFGGGIVALHTASKV
jgi:demethylmenaquinone methyltransferase/2-methoxy-6-polyprenyl-1,4-benzoquinol methylase